MWINLVFKLEIWRKTKTVMKRLHISINLCLSNLRYSAIWMGDVWELHRGILTNMSQEKKEKALREPELMLGDKFSCFTRSTKKNVPRRQMLQNRKKVQIKGDWSIVWMRSNTSYRISYSQRMTWMTKQKDKYSCAFIPFSIWGTIVIEYLTYQVYACFVRFSFFLFSLRYVPICNLMKAVFNKSYLPVVSSVI